MAGWVGYAGWRGREVGGSLVSGRGEGRAAAGWRADGEPAAAEVVVAGAMSREAFLPHLRSEFERATAGGVAVACRLIEVGAAEELSGPAGRFTSFALLFAAPKGFDGESRIYQVRHARMGSMELFMSPVGKCDKEVRMEAVFSQRI